MDTAYAYHVTLAEFLPSIRKEGLLANRHKHAGGEPVIFVEPDQEEAEIYATDKTVTLRFPVKGFGCTPDGECVVDGPIAPEHLDVCLKGKWQPVVPAVESSALARAAVTPPRKGRETKRIE